MGYVHLFLVLVDRHFDHTGNPAAFPNAEVIIHAVEKDGAPCLKEHTRVKTFDFRPDCKPVASFEQSHDFFDDGSLLLLDGGGHTEGHLAALVRTGQDEYVLLAADCCHHYLLLSQNPAHAHLELGAPMYDDLPRASLTLEKLRVAERRDEVMVVLAHNGPQWNSSEWTAGQKNKVVELSGWRKRGLKSYTV